MEPLLVVKNLHVTLDTPSGPEPLLRDVSFTLYPHETLALVGESGSGKTITAMSIMNLFRSPLTKVAGGTIEFQGQNLLKKSQSEMRALRGKSLAFIPQSPLSCLNPTLQIGTQLMETMSTELYPTKEERYHAASEMLRQVGFSDCMRRLAAYPYELSGGMRQRLLIAMALVNKPKLVIADEPTTALDVTIQAQVLDLLMQLQKEMGMSLLFITHDMGVVAKIADRVAVMYAGNIVEQATIREIFTKPEHPYTEALLGCLPRLKEHEASSLKPIQGSPPQIGQYLGMCSFMPRCPYAMKICTEKAPELVGADHQCRCFRRQAK
ncbi:MAG: ABC transporter ATP-binding protein [Verrucomicrobia bacterium]|nr:ABC transporter ATP-binding protein [Verrucomicrobiota bacterium]MBS0636876.1 ABC transporter ATP-binding protein [Verrucomicrobiota bacterium]